MKSYNDYASRFRILKGGKISLVVSALIATAATSTAVHATTTIGSTTSAEEITVSSGDQIDVIGNVTVSYSHSAPTLNALKLDNPLSNDFDFEITSSGRIELDVTSQNNDDWYIEGVLVNGKVSTDSSIINNGTILVSDTSGGGAGYMPAGIRISTGDSVFGSWPYLYDGFVANNGLIENNGTISVSSNYPNTEQQNAVGIYFGDNLWNIFDNNGTINNSGTIEVDANRGWGILMAANTGTITNDGNITITTNTNLGGNAVGISVHGSESTGNIYNNGNIVVDSLVGLGSTGITVNKLTGNIVNDGMIKATGNNVLDAYAYSVIIGSSGYYDQGTLTNTINGKMYGNMQVTNMENYGLVSLPFNAMWADSDGSRSAALVLNSFTNHSDAVLEIGLNTDGTMDNTQYSQVTYTWGTTPTITLEDNSILRINVLSSSTNQEGIIGERLDDIIETGGILVVNPEMIKLEDNSDVLDFSIIVDDDSINDNTLDLNITADSGPGGEATNYRQTQTVEANKHIFNIMHNIVELRQRQTGQESGTNGGDLMTKDEQFWFKPFYSTGSQNDKGSQNGFDFTTRGFGVGYDAEIFGKSRAGLALFYTLADVETNNVADKTDITNYTALLYGSMPIKSGNTFMYQFAYGTQNNEGLRYIDEEDLTKYSTSDYDSTFAAIDLKWMGEYAFSNDIIAKPLVAASYRSFKTPSYQETGHNTDAALIVESSTVNQFILSAGEIFEYKVDNQTNFITDVRVGYDFNHGDNEVTASFEANPEIIRTNGIDNGGIVYNLGFSYETDKEDSTFNLNYNLVGEGTDFQNHIFSAKYVFKF